MIRTAARFCTRAVLGTVCLLFALGTAAAAPMPWLISNLDPAGETTFIRDPQGEITDHALLVQLILDRGGDGPNPPSTLMGTIGQPTGNDRLLIQFVTWPQTDVVPNGSFILNTYIDTDNPAVPPSARAYIRVFNSNNLRIGTPFSDSQRFPGPAFPSGGQTVVRLPERMRGYIGNTMPQVTAEPMEITVAAGDAATVTVSVEDDGDYLRFYADTTDLPGGGEAVTVIRIDDNTARIAWTPPFGTTGDFILPCIVSDGQYTVTRRVEVEVTEDTDSPSAFHLAAPMDNGILWESIGFSWQQAHDPEGEDVEYTLIWASDEDFSDADSLTGITETSAVIDFETFFGMQRRRDPGKEWNMREDDLGGVSRLSPARERNDSPRRFAKPGPGKDDTRRQKTTSPLNPAPGPVEMKQPADTRLTGKDKDRRAFRPEIDDRIRGSAGDSRRGKITADPDSPPVRKRDTLHRESELDIDEGDTVYWYVRAYDPEGNGRASEETWSAVAERPDAPGRFRLLSPEHRSDVETLMPTLSWRASFDPDEIDTVKYDLIWSLDEWETVDTIKGIPDTMFAFDEPRINSLPGAEDFIQAYWSLAGDGVTGELDEFEDNTRVWWTVDAVDLAGLRAAAYNVWYFDVDVPDAPGGFNLMTPADRFLFSHVRPVLLQWTNAPEPDGDGVRYDVLATSNPQAMNPRIFPMVARGIEDTGYILDVGEEDDRWWKWTVRAISGDDTTWAAGGGNGYFRFAVSEPDRPEHFDLVSPENEGLSYSTRPAFSWLKPYDPDLLESMKYTLYYSTDAWATVDSITGIRDTVFVFPAEPDTGEGMNAGNEGEEGLFGIRPPAGPKPAGTSSPGGNAELDEFEDGATVHWKVRVQDRNSVGRWSLPLEGWSFTIDENLPPDPFRLYVPGDGAEFFEPEVTFVWEASDDPEGGEIGYALVIADNPHFDTPDSFATTADSLVADLSNYRMGDYWWKVVAIDEVGLETESREIRTFRYSYTGVESEPEQPLPTEYAIAAAYPNPFNPAITITVAIPETAPVGARIFDLLGREVMRIGERVFQPGYHQLRVDFTSYPSGTYFLELTGKAEGTPQQRITLVK